MACGLAAAALAGCGEDAEPAAPAAQRAGGVGEDRVGSVAPLAMCRDWRAGTEEERRATIADIRRQVNLQDTPTRTPALSDADAYRVFENNCAEDFAAGFRLYKLYARAAGFQSLQAR